MDEVRTDPQDGAARWPAWFAPVGFFAAFAASLVLGSALLGVAALMGLDTDSPAATTLATLAQDCALVGTAVAFAAWVARPTPADFGLRATTPKRAATGAAAGLAAFYATSAAYAALVQPRGEQDVLGQLGADRGGAYLLTAGVVVIVVAPFAEELFFRGFMFRALQNRFPPVAAAAIVGVLFGSVHYAGPDTLTLLPVLAALGFVFCVIYQWTGSLYPVIAMHAVNNAIAFGTTADRDHAVAIAGALLAAVLAACAVGVVRGPRRAFA